MFKIPNFRGCGGIERINVQHFLLLNSCDGPERSDFE